MGIRISMSLVVGVDNYEGANDKRFTKPFVWENVQEEMIAIADHGASVLPLVGNVGEVEAYKMFCVPTEDYGAPNLFGVVAGEAPYADSILYALASIDERFQQDGYVEVGKHGTYDEERLVLKNKPGAVNVEQFYKLGLAWDFVVWLDSTEFLFDWVGFNVNREDLRLFLEWHWS